MRSNSLTSAGAGKETEVFTFMEVCGTHTVAISRWGLRKILRENIRLISGPGCPVCVTSQADIDKTILLARKKNAIITTFGDMLRVPSRLGSLEREKAQGRDIRVVYSPLDALKMAEDNPHKKIVFLGVGFETTSPLIASVILTAKRKKIKNFFVLPLFKLIFPALEFLSKAKDLNIDGFICPGHVSVITGSKPYEVIAKKYKKPCVITGFEAEDIIEGIIKLVRQRKRKVSRVEIAYKRAVKSGGNTKAKELIKKVFKVNDSFWRGLGLIKKSGLVLREEFKRFSAEEEFKLREVKSSYELKGCICGEILKGKFKPSDCKLFGKVCTPQKPVGPCMVSSEGACSAYYKYE